MPKEGFGARQKADWGPAGRVVAGSVSVSMDGRFDALIAYWKLYAAIAL
jgi:hypothetical protein